MHAGAALTVVLKEIEAGKLQRRRRTDAERKNSLKIRKRGSRRCQDA